MMKTTHLSSDRIYHAEFNKDWRLSVYKRLTPWAAFGGIVPVAVFLNRNILHTPKPISRTFTGYERDQVPMGDYHETYSYQYASSGDHALDIMGFVLGIFAAIAVALMFYCIARFLADPIMYQIDLHTEKYSNLQRWLKRIVMGFVVLLFCGSMVFAGEYRAYPEDQYIWLSDGQGTEYRVNKEEYDKYRGNTKSESDNETDSDTDVKEEGENEDLSKTPIERGYPSNDLQYYIDHPDEPMPQELINELTGPEEYNPGLEYDGYDQPY